MSVEDLRLKDVLRLNVQPGDTIVVSLADAAPAELVTQLAERLEEWHPGVNFVVCEAKAEWRVVSESPVSVQLEIPPDPSPTVPPTREGESTG